MKIIKIPANSAQVFVGIPIQAGRGFLASEFIALTIHKTFNKNNLKISKIDLGAKLPCLLFYLET